MRRPQGVVADWKWRDQSKERKWFSEGLQQLSISNRLKIINDVPSIVASGEQYSTSKAHETINNIKVKIIDLNLAKVVFCPLIFPALLLSS